MKNLLITLGVLAAACAAAFAVFFALNGNAAMHAAARENDAMAWLRTEFRLDGTQFTAIKQLHEEYSVGCGAHCMAIMAARERRAPAAEIAALEKTCVDAMTAHFRRVAALMPPAEGQRYLATVLPRIAGYAHAGAPNLQVKP